MRVSRRRVLSAAPASDASRKQNPLAVVVLSICEPHAAILSNLYLYMPLTELGLANMPLNTRSTTPCRSHIRT